MVPPVALCVSSALLLTSNSLPDQLPAIYNALTVDAKTPPAKCTLFWKLKPCFLATSCVPSQ